MTETATTPDRARAEPLALYIHWPFCRSKCPYCDFNSHVRDGIDQSAWRDALLAELKTEIERLPGRRLTSIFFGGGTPSLMEPDTAASLIETATTAWTPDGDIEITLEANPTSVEAETFPRFRDAGVNRVSLGVQSLYDGALAFLGREHSGAEARAAVALAARHFERFSFDLIYARPGQTEAAWRTELGDALAMAGDHLSLYQLTIERGTAFFPRWRDGAFTMPDDDSAAALYELTRTALIDHGHADYEISNYARPGAECRHNLTYWRYGDYAGIGPGAHGRLRTGGQKRSFRRIAHPENWLAAVGRSGHGIQETVALEPSEIFEEMMLMGLRLREGLDLGELQRQSCRAFDETVPADHLADLVELGFLERDMHRLRATDEGRLRLNAVMARLLA